MDDGDGKQVAASIESLFFSKQEARGYWQPKSGVIKEKSSEEVV